jgi:hypothetical protein
MWGRREEIRLQEQECPRSLWEGEEGPGLRKTSFLLLGLCFSTWYTKWLALSQLHH